MSQGSRQLHVGSRVTRGTAVAEILSEWLMLDKTRKRVICSEISAFPEQFFKKAEFQQLIARSTRRKNGAESAKRQLVWIQFECPRRFYSSLCLFAYSHPVHRLLCIHSLIHWCPS